MTRVMIARSYMTSRQGRERAWHYCYPFWFYCVVDGRK